MLEEANSVRRRRYGTSKRWSSESFLPSPPPDPQPVWPVVPQHETRKYESPFLMPRKLEWGGSATADILIDDIRELVIAGLRRNYAVTLEELGTIYRFPNAPQIPAFPDGPVCEPLEELPADSGEPKWENFAPKVGLVRRLLSLDGRQHQGAMLQFTSAQRNWKETQETRSKITARNKQRVAAFERRAEVWWGAKRTFDAALAAERERYNKARLEYSQQIAADYAKLQRILERRSKGESDAVSDYHELVAYLSLYPAFLPREVSCSYDPAIRTLLIEHALLDFANVRVIQSSSLKSSKLKPVSKSEKREAIVLLHAAVALRSVYEAGCADDADALDWIGFNGHVTFRDPVNGQLATLNVLSCFVSKAEAIGIDLQHVDPAACLRGWKARMFPNVDSYVAVQPILHLNKADGRIVESREILEGLAVGSNLAAMPWEDFEHLIRELFEKEFGTSGAEVKVTRASRDWGVDAIVFDQDPIRGGKFVIQAKRYTRLVDVAAVRDLYGTLVNEGANRGFLVTTSGFGPESINFAKDKPITLIDGAALLGLLRKHNYNFRIDIEEARKLQHAREN